MKQYPKTYENVFKEDRNNRCNYDLIKSHLGLDYRDYAEIFRKQINKFQKEVFDGLVKYEWLRRQFCYNGKRKIQNRHNGMNLEIAYGVFMKQYVGYDNRMFSQNHFYAKVLSYIPIFFPNISDVSPFEKKYKYPFRYMILECLLVVYVMKERMEILEYCEKKKMSYVQFLNYIINYIYCYNDDVGYHYYEWKFTASYIPVVYINKEHRRVENELKKI